jgi:hypothetical protein
LTFTVGPERLRFFDPDDGRALDGVGQSQDAGERSRVGTAG